MHRKTPIITCALAGMMFAGLFMTTALAQEDTASGQIAVVSLQQIQADYVQLQSQEENLGAWLQDRRDYHDRLTDFVFLSKTDFEEALELMRKPDPRSDDDQARLDELRGISESGEERYAELRAKPDRTAEEAAEFNTLQDMYDASAQTLQGVQQSIMEELSDRRETALAGLMDTVEQAIDETAQAAGYDVVLDADMVFYGGDDITDDVLTVLNEGLEPPAEAEDVEDEQDEQGEQGGAEGGEETADEDG